MIQNTKVKPKRSLRWILALWFLTFSIVPILFLTFYSLRKFQQTVDNELINRLKGNASEIKVILSEYQKTMANSQMSYIKNSSLQNSLANVNLNHLEVLASDWLSSSMASSISIYSRTGELLFEKRKGGQNSQNSVVEGIKKIVLSSNIQTLLTRKQILLIPDYSHLQLLDLAMISPVYRNQTLIGYLRQTLTLDANFLKRISERMQIQGILIEPNGRIIVGSHPDFALYKSDFFSEYINIPKLKTITLTLRGEPYGFVFNKIPWGNENILVALAASKKDSNTAIENLRVAYYTMLAIMFALLVLSVIAASNVVLRPLSELIEAIQDLHLGENIIELPIKSDNEVGQLTTSFNDLSRRILAAQRELKDKIKELEDTNRNLKETQSQLVHSAKMASLGQLVAGVAHELNNPIGFIYSNMEHLRDYSDSLLKIINIAEKEPEKISELKKEYDLDFIAKDLPKLISSCEDGARRTKEIVIGLRNFSRLEEKAFRPIDIHHCIETTLNLLNSEFKNRIEVKKEFGELPHIICNQNQINQVLMNILSNAAQAIEGSGTVWITTRAVPQVAGTASKGITISIQDSGPGVPADLLQKIFDPFFTTKGVGKGTGLGLAISYGIINSHGGTISVTSKLGSGTEFVITLPIEPPKNPEASL